MSDVVVLAIIGAFPLTVAAVASIISAVRSTQSAKETRPNGGSSMRDEIQRIAVAVESAENHASTASQAAMQADATARLAAEGVARADAFHLYMHDRVHDLANGIVGSTAQVAMLRRELGLDPTPGDRRAAARPNPILPDRLYPPAGRATPNPFGSMPDPTKE